MITTHCQRAARTELPVTSPPHGFSDDEETRRLLRSRPPRRALDWVSRAVGGTVASTRALRGGMSSAVHLVTVVQPHGARDQVVLRRYVRPELNEEEPDLAAHEATILRFVETVDLPTPLLVALDATGAEAGAPAIIMSRLPGRVDWSPADLGLWVAHLAETLPAVHGATLPAPGVLCAFAPWAQESYEPPSWTARPRLWERAVELVHGPAPDLPAVFIQRDFHPGNVLWRRHTVSGVVDWQAACVGPASIDVGHCRVNLFRYGLEAADRFSTVWEHLTGGTYHPWADVVAIVGLLDALRHDPGSDAPVMEEALGRALGELGRPT